ncbi:trypsin-like peptidase domain-containing protein [Comamonas sp. JC664]|uniref:trypsin-like peptidase domain-containing protein n=1 Tax=Comamonas sp. JC664 TaxID=2801917 RepID=UPI0017493218|nr:trypsin-like peptidase domain-containing protein [Comamonas sp. JC664]MBL0694922.1 trypsin-like peptidase domain-containing protein [Comamonas sp. JC664]GHG95281.1 peptidase [Comamonas sp. KCTC 72670]
MMGRARGLTVGLLLGLMACRRDAEETPPASAPSTQPAPPAEASSTPPLPPGRAVALASVAPLVASVSPAVVNVEVRIGVSAREGPENTPWGGGGPSPFGGAPWDDEDTPWGGEGPSPFGGAPSPFEDSVPFAPPVREGIGSGFIIDAKGWVLTNHHLVADAEEIQVQLADGRDLEARVMGSDPLTDVAVLQLQLPEGAKPLPVVRLGDSDALRVGDWVVAIGNPFGLTSSTSLGILSAKERNIEAGPFDDFLQTDAAINPGNSGGPLFNLHGEVVGINTAIAGEGSGIGFAVPSNLVKALLPQLERKGTISRGWLGLLVQDVTPDLGEALGAPVREGAVITDVTKETAAARAGLQPDDVIVSVDGQPVDSARALTRSVAMKAPGSELSLTLYRDARKRDVKATLGKRPDLEGVADDKPAEDSQHPAEHRVGLSVMDMDPRLAESEELPEAGALVTEVAPASMAEHAGMIPGMVVVEAANQPVRVAQDVVRALRKAKPGERVLLRVALPGGGRELRALTVPAK